MTNKKMPVREILLLLIGELLVCTIVSGIYLLLDLAFGKDWFSYKVITGGLIGTCVIVLNFVFLSVSMNRAFDLAIEARGDKEMSEEEIEEFAAQYQGKFQNSVKLSYIIRTLSMLVCLIAALVFDFANVIATVIPFLLFRPILMVISLLKRGNG